MARETDHEQDRSRDDLYLDSCRGWLVVAAAACSLFMYMGVIYSWGIFQARMAAEFGHSLTTLTFVGSLATSFMVSLCIPVGESVRAFGYRRVAFVGALSLGLGEFLSGWAIDGLWPLFITHGVLFGFGGSLTILPCTTVPLHWFRKYRGLATGVVFAGGSLGAAVMAVVADQLCQTVGVRWTFRILGFVIWTVCLPAAWFIEQPLQSKASVPQLQWYRFREAKFVMLLVGGAISCFPLFVPPYFIPVFARSVELSGVLALSVWNIASTFGRVFAGYSADSFLGPMNSVLVALSFCGVSCLFIWPFVTNLGLLIMFAIFNGIGCGSFFSLFPLVVGSLFGSANTMGVLPVLWQAWVFGYFLGTPIAAKLYSQSGAGSDVASYRPAAYYAGATAFVGIAFMLSLCFMDMKQKKEPRDEEEKPTLTRQMLGKR